MVDIFTVLPIYITYQIYPEPVEYNHIVTLSDAVNYFLYGAYTLRILRALRVYRKLNFLEDEVQRFLGQMAVSIITMILFGMHATITSCYDCCHYYFDLYYVHQILPLCSIWKNILRIYNFTHGLIIWWWPLRLWDMVTLRRKALLEGAIFSFWELLRYFYAAIIISVLSKSFLKCVDSVLWCIFVSLSFICPRKPTSWSRRWIALQYMLAYIIILVAITNMC